jgi:hypothetical protein
MSRRRKRDIENPLKLASFPVILEHGEAKAIVMDMQKYRELELLIDNLINLREEDEDAVITESEVLEKLIRRARDESKKLPRRTNWGDELDAL